jgi:branched-chain amino acid transport system ATP-binding protein
VVDNVALAAGRTRTRSPWVALNHLDRGPPRARALDLLRLVGIADAAGIAPGNLPLGHLKRLELARALALEPQLLLLDEPLAGLNQVEAAQLADTIMALNREGRTVILIEHNLGEVLRICRRLVVLDNGRKLADGAPHAVIADRSVRAAYLGEGENAAA